MWKSSGYIGLPYCAVIAAIYRIHETRVRGAGDYLTRRQKKRMRSGTARAPSARSAEPRSRRAATRLASAPVGTRREGGQPGHSAKAGEPLLDLAAATVGTYLRIVLEESQNEDLKLVAAGAAFQIVRRH
jgi:hypothetical protein